MNFLEAEVPNFGKVIITHTCFETISRYRQLENMPETGGSLVGYLRSDDVWVIAKAMEPSPKNKAGRYWLQSCLGAAQRFVDMFFKQTDGALNYIGEWHTHPEEDPNPSPKDFKMMDDILINGKIATGFVFGLILGDTGKLCLWHQDRSSHWVTPIKVPPLFLPASF